jgi:methanethiol S-methyltransferase
MCGHHDEGGGTMKTLDRVIITLAIIIGVGSILLLVVGGSRAFTDFGLSERDLLLWDAALSLLFFLQHSGMVRKPFRAWLARAVPPVYHGSVYTVASGIVLAAVVICWQRSDVVLWSGQGMEPILMHGVGFLALLVFAWGVLSFESFDIFGVAPLRARLHGRVFQSGPFEVRGPYQWVRHPLYSAILVMFWSNPDITSDRLLFNALWTAWIVGATVLEERDLVREFGTLYTEYQAHVPMLVPFRRPWTTGAPG